MHHGAGAGVAAVAQDDGGKAEVFESNLQDSASLDKSQHVQDKETQEAAAMWRRAPKELVADDDDEFDDYFKGMFP